MNTLTADDIASAIESHGSAGSLNVEIRVRMSKRAINEEDKTLLRETCEKIHEALIKETLRLDPKRIQMRQDWITECRSLFEQAGLGPIYMEEIPNEYSQGDVNEPWFTVTTRIGHIKIGWRKRVVNIDWSRSACLEGGKTLFPNEDVTKGDDDRERYIHAWSYEKAVEYLKVLAANVDKPRCKGSYVQAIRGTTSADPDDKYRLLIQCSECGKNVPTFGGYPYKAASHDPRAA